MREKRDDSPDIPDIPDEKDEKITLHFQNIESKEKFEMEVDPYLNGFELLSKLNDKYPGKNPVLQMNEASGSEAMVI